MVCTYNITIYLLTGTVWYHVIIYVYYVGVGCNSTPPNEIHKYSASEFWRHPGIKPAYFVRWLYSGCRQNTLAEYL